MSGYENTVALTMGMSNSNEMYHVRLNDGSNILFNVCVYGTLLNLQKFDELPIQWINKAFFVHLFVLRKI